MFMVPRGDLTKILEKIGEFPRQCNQPFFSMSADNDCSTKQIRGRADAPNNRCLLDFGASMTDRYSEGETDKDLRENDLGNHRHRIDRSVPDVGGVR
jgi:hypothetical protein